MERDKHPLYIASLQTNCTMNAGVTFFELSLLSKPTQVSRSRLSRGCDLRATVEHLGGMFRMQSLPRVVASALHRKS